MGSAGSRVSGSYSRPRIFFGWWIVAGSWLIYLVIEGLFYTATVFLKPLAQEFGWSRAQVSGAFSVGLLIAGLSAPLWGRIADRRGARLALVPGVLVSGVLFILLSQTQSLFSLYTLYILLCVGAGGISVIPLTVLLSNWFVEKRGRATGIAFTGLGFGTLILTPVAGYLTETLGWRYAYIASGLLVLVPLTPIVLLMKNKPEELGLLPDGAKSSRSAAGTEGTVAQAGYPAAVGSSVGQEALAESSGDGLSLREGVRIPAFWITSVSWFLLAIPESAIWLHQVPFMTDLGLSTQSASFFAGFAGGMSIVGGIAFGFLAERYSIRYVFLACYLVLAMAILTLLASNRADVAFLYLYVPLFGIALGGSYTVYPLLVADLFGIRALGAIFGLLGIAYMIGAALGPTVAGYLFDLSGSYEIVFILSLALTLIGSALILLVGHPGGSASSKGGKR